MSDQQKELMSVGDARTMGVNAVDSDAEDSWYNRVSKTSGPRPALMITLALTATALVAWWAFPGGATATPHRSQGAIMGPARTLLQSEELTEILLVESRNVDLTTQDLSEADLRNGVREIMDEFGSLVDDHLDSRSRAALQHAIDSAHIDPAMFSNFRKMFYGLRDPALVGLGRRVFGVLGNLSATPLEVQRVLKGNLGMNDTEVRTLKAMVPEEFFNGLRDRGGLQDISLGFSPAAIDHIRHPRNSAAKADWDNRMRKLMGGTQQAALRRLSAASITIGVVAVNVVALIEIFVQMQVFINGFEMPAWLWSMFVVPYLAVGSAQCGMSGVHGSAGAVMCDVFLGSIAFNMLEYIFLGFDR